MLSNKIKQLVDSALIAGLFTFMASSATASGWNDSRYDDSRGYNDWRSHYDSGSQGNMHRQGKGKARSSFDFSMGAETDREMQGDVGSDAYSRGANNWDNRYYGYDRRYNGYGPYYAPPAADGYVPAQPTAAAQ